MLFWNLNKTVFFLFLGSKEAVDGDAVARIIIVRMKRLLRHNNN